MIKPANQVVNFIKRLSSINSAGGLAVSDSAIRYLRMDDEGKMITASLRLPVGIVEGGKIKDKELAIKAFQQVRSMISSGRDIVDVVVTIESGVVYSQFFTLPQLDAAGLKEAAALNIQMISPINISQAYYGYQMIGETAGGIGYEFLGGFVPASAIDDWMAVLHMADFLPVAVEFQSMSVVRAAMQAGGLDKSSVNLVIDISSEGLDISLIKNGNLYFDYFYPWKSIQGEDRSISFDKLKTVITAEIGKVMNFSLSRFGSEVKNVVVNAESIGSKVIEAVRAQFPSVRVDKLTFGKTVVAASWAAAFGASLRGAMSRSEDEFISLSPLTANEEYVHQQIINMVGLWGRVFVGVLIFLVFIYGGSNLFLRRARLDVDKQTIRGLSGSESQEFSNLSKEAALFNQLVSLVGEAKRGENRIYPFLEKLSGLGSDIRLTRLSIPSLFTEVAINGTAPSADAVSRFHSQLSAIKGITDIQFPLSSLVTSTDGRTSFIMSFKVLNFNLP